MKGQLALAGNIAKPPREDRVDPNLKGFQGRTLGRVRLVHGDG